MTTLDLGKLLKPAPHDVCPHASGPQRVLVAWSVVGSRAVVLSASCGVMMDMNEAGIDACDVWNPDKEGISDAERFSLWEGSIESTHYPSTSDRAEEWDHEYVGEWSAAPEAAILAVARGENPYGCRECGGSGWVKVKMPKEER